MVPAAAALSSIMVISLPLCWVPADHEHQVVRLAAARLAQLWFALA